MKYKLKNGEEVDLEITMRKLFKYEKETGDHSITRMIAENSNQGASVETCCKVIYIGYICGKNNQKYSLNDFMDNINFNIADIINTAYELVSSNSKN